jgi:hypothetical protein
MRGVGESTKGKIKALDLCVPDVAGISSPAKKILSTVGYNAKEFKAL